MTYKAPLVGAPAPSNHFLDEYDLAFRHKRSVRTVRNDRIRGAGVPFIRIGRSVRYRLSDVERYEDERLCTSTSSNGGDRDR
jgi:hypothetical protein